ncbi:hypothetical protein DYD21_03600 [Rhodohalobacter sp. SW132]|uniref:hypothetical protein n=1 Tax=Rhodohalobacter sp. SW132 TaxID=2293433 RepID=UPI000E26992A|nr:hypothetical protein [Rhodohalobacter sp. SW132]REL39053.1 hypothetical protein DYD21_03600 [Rhodohalobacter sp. SW132]
MKFIGYSFLSTFIAIFVFISCNDQTTGTDSDTNGDSGNGPHPSQFNHTLSPGSSNEAFITDTDFDQLIVEVQYMPGSAPTNGSLDNLKEFLETHLDKASVILLDPVEIPSGGQDAYSAEDVRDLEKQHREQFTDGSTLASYAIFLDGEFSTRNVLGIAYYNTSTAYFAETIHRISGGIGQPSRSAIESTVFNHEYGHLMGLVNNGTDMQHDHHDSDNGAHCTVEECLMYFSVNTTDFFANLFGGSVPELDEFCVADINALK